MILFMKWEEQQSDSKEYFCYYFSDGNLSSLVYVSKIKLMQNFRMIV